MYTADGAETHNNKGNRKAAQCIRLNSFKSIA